MDLMASCARAQANDVRPWWRAPYVPMVAAAFVFRIAWMFVWHTYRFGAAHNHFGFGYETGSIAAAIARGEGFSSPFAAPTGPTTWIGPIYPYLLAGIFKLLGIYSDASAVVILTINSVFAALTCWTIYAIAEQIFDTRVARIAASIWAAVPFFYRWAVGFVWDPPVSAFLLTLGVLLTLRTQTAAWKRWLWMGVLAGVSVLVNPALVTLFPMLFAMTAVRLWHAGRPSWKQTAVAILLIPVIVSPWLIRNRAVFGKWIFVRGNFGFEFSLGNFPGSPGVPWSGGHPAANPRILDEYRTMGEVAFVKAKQKEAFDWVKRNPGEFMSLSLKRATDFWDGSELNYEPRTEPWRPWMILATSLPALFGVAWSLARRNWKMMYVVAVLLVYPLPYYITYTNPRYRHAIEPLMVVGIAYFVWSLWESLFRRNAQLA